MSARAPSFVSPRVFQALLTRRGPRSACAAEGLLERPNAWLRGRGRVSFAMPCPLPNAPRRRLVTPVAARRVSRRDRRRARLRGALRVAKPRAHRTPQGWASQVSTRGLREQSPGETVTCRSEGRHVTILRRKKNRLDPSPDCPILPLEPSRDKAALILVWKRLGTMRAERHVTTGSGGVTEL